VVPFAAAAATIANVVFYYLLTRGLGEPLLMLSDSPTRDLVPMPAWEVVLFSLIFSIPAGIVFAILARANKKPVRNFMIISLVVLVLSIFLPLRMPTPPVAMTAKLGLVTMHVIGAIVVVGTLVLASRRRTASTVEG
jgi:hypothetical protein